MNINIETPHFTADQKLRDFIENKLEKLGQYYDQIIGAQVTLKLENSGQVRDKVVEINLKVPGENLFAKDIDKTFEAAVDQVTGTLKRRLIKHKESQRAHR